MTDWAVRIAKARQAREQGLLNRRLRRNSLTAYICDECRKANRAKATHPGVLHQPGICDCACRR